MVANKRGFSLIEVLIATIVMSMIMGSVLAFVQYAGNIWNYGQEEIDAKNYSRMAFEYIKEELLEATEIERPKNEDISELIEYKKKVDICLEFTLCDKRLIKKIDADNSTPITIARNVKEFKVRRLSKRTFEINLIIQKEQSEDEILDGVEPEILTNETMVFIAPGIN